MTDYQTPERMALKERAIPLPDLAGKTVLDIGCDHGHWCWLAADRGARVVIGLDRGRKVRGVMTDLAERNSIESARNGHSKVCAFTGFDLGKEWADFGIFDVTLIFSAYHHAYENCADHDAVWFWLRRHTAGVLLWEGPTGTEDDVVRMNVTHRYERAEIKAAAERYFDVEVIGPALHVSTREVWRCHPKPLRPATWTGKAKRGAGGAAAAFNYANGRRIAEIEQATGVAVLPGSLNVELDRPFDWNAHYFRVRVLDVRDRKSGLDSDWTPRWARLYPVTAKGGQAFVFRFEGDRYAETFVELISAHRLAGEERIEFVG